MKKTTTAPQELAEGRADKFLASWLDLSRSRLKALFDGGNVRVNGHRIPKGFQISQGDEVEVELPDEVQNVRPNGAISLKVLYQDAHLVAVEKPAFLPIHPLEAGETDTLANGLIALFPECASASPDAPLECGIVHRLDTDTSGAVLAARTPEAYAMLRRMFSDRRVEKEYIALVGGLPAPQGSITFPIAHHPTNQARMVVCGDSDEAALLKARDATTNYSVLRWIGDWALLSVRIPTGCRHQIRVHLSSIGAPIVGDALYGGEAMAGLKRQFLHARSISFDHPVTQRRIEVTSELPGDLSAVLKRLGG